MELYGRHLISKAFKKKVCHKIMILLFQDECSVWWDINNIILIHFISKTVLRIYPKYKTYLRQGSLLGEVLADQQPGVSPLDIEVSVEGDAEVLVGHLGDVLDVHADGDEGGLGLQGQVVLLVVGWDADSLATPHCTDQVPPGVWGSTWSSTHVLWKATFRRN